MTKTTYAVIRIDYEHDGWLDESELNGIVADLVVERASAHNHTEENGIRIVNIDNCGEPL